MQEPGERLGLLREVAGLYEGRINDKAKAFDRYLAAFEIAPGVFLPAGALQDAELPFLRSAVLESLRLWPTTPLLLRDTTAETTWENGTLPKGTGVLYRYPAGTTMTLRECARFLIKESDNTAEVMLNRYLGEEEIEAELRRVGARSTSYWMPNTTTPGDVVLVELPLDALGVGVALEPRRGQDPAHAAHHVREWLRRPDRVLLADHPADHPDR